MTLETAPIEVLESMYKKLRRDDFCEIPEYEQWVDIREYWEFVDKIENEIKKRKENKDALVKETRFVKYEIHGEEFYVVKLIANSKDCDVLCYEKKYCKLSLSTERTNDLPYYFTVDSDNRIRLAFGDDEGGSCYPIEISEEEYNKYTDFSIKQWKEFVNSSEAKIFYVEKF